MSAASSSNGVYDSGWLLPSNDDLCVNTDRLTPHQAAELIVAVFALR